MENNEIKYVKPKTLEIAQTVVNTFFALFALVCMVIGIICWSNSTKTVSKPNNSTYSKHTQTTTETDSAMIGIGMAWLFGGVLTSVTGILLANVLFGACYDLKAIRLKIEQKPTPVFNKNPSPAKTDTLFTAKEAQPLDKKTFTCTRCGRTISVGWKECPFCKFG